MVQKKTTKKSASKQSAVKYENNPFFIAGNGITRLFDLARGVAVLLLVLSIVSFLFSGTRDDNGSPQTFEQFTNTFAAWNMNEWVLAIGAGIIIGLAVLMVSALFSGIASYTAYRLSKGENATVSEAFHAAFDNLWGYIWLQIVIFVKILLWSMLLVLPGIYFAFRYTLAGVAFFDESKNLRGNAAIKESLRLTKGAWLTTFASNTLFNILTFGILSSIITTGVNTVLYSQFDALGVKPKPAAHWLSWVTLALPLVLFFFAVALMLATLMGIAIGTHTAP